MKTAYWLLSRVIRAVFITVVISAFIHLAIVFGDFVGTGNVAYINPVTFLGIDTVAPRYGNSEVAVAVGWAVLIAVGSLIFAILNRQFIKRQLVYVRRFLSD